MFGMPGSYEKYRLEMMAHGVVCGNPKLTPKQVAERASAILKEIDRQYEALLNDRESRRQKAKEAIEKELESSEDLKSLRAEREHALVKLQKEEAKTRAAWAAIDSEKEKRKNKGASPETNYVDAREHKDAADDIYQKAKSVVRDKEEEIKERIRKEFGLSEYD